MYDALTSRFTFSCPAQGDTRVRLSAFRTLERLPGAAHPAVYRIRFACPCGDEHDGLVAHDDLDWSPLAPAGGVFLNLMTSRLDDVGIELAGLAASRIGAGEWPWSFFCYPEERPRPVFPSAFRVLAPGDGAVGLAVCCPACASVSVNLVSEAHVEVPFHNDGEIGVVEHVFPVDADRLVDRFRAELDSVRFDVRRRGLE